MNVLTKMYAATIREKILTTIGTGKRVTLTQLRAMLPAQIQGETFDAAVLLLQAQGKIALYHCDCHHARTAELTAGAIQVSITTYHYAYLTQ